jgi:hypothetical protein
VSLAPSVECDSETSAVKAPSLVECSDTDSVTTTTTTTTTTYTTSTTTTTTTAEAFDLHDVAVPVFKEFDALCDHLDTWPDRKRQDWLKPLRFLLKLMDEVQCSAATKSKTADANCATNTDDDTVSSTDTAHVGAPGASALLPLPSIEELLGWLSRIESNAFGTSANNGTTAGDQIVPYAAMFNHSCNPNVEIEALRDEDGGASRVVTLSDIEVGEEILLSYIPTNLPASTRQTRLQDGYHFKCACSRCVSELALNPKQRPKVAYEKSRSKEKNRPPKKKLQVITPLKPKEIAQMVEHVSKPLPATAAAIPSDAPQNSVA